MEGSVMYYELEPDSVSFSSILVHIDYDEIKYAIEALRAIGNELEDFVSVEAILDLLKKSFDQEEDITIGFEGLFGMNICVAMMEAVFEEYIYSSRTLWLNSDLYKKISNLKKDIVFH